MCVALAETGCYLDTKALMPLSLLCGGWRTPPSLFPGDSSPPPEVSRRNPTHCQSEGQPWLVLMTPPRAQTDPELRPPLAETQGSQ